MVSGSNATLVSQNYESVCVKNARQRGGWYNCGGDRDRDVSENIWHMITSNTSAGVGAGTGPISGKHREEAWPNGSPNSCLLASTKLRDLIPRAPPPPSPRSRVLAPRARNQVQHRARRVRRPMERPPAHPHRGRPAVGRRRERGRRQPGHGAPAHAPPTAATAAATTATLLAALLAAATTAVLLAASLTLGDSLLSLGCSSLSLGCLLPH